MKKWKLAILDMYEGEPNQGMRCIKEIVERFNEDIEYSVFDVRSKAEVADTSFDIYISTGGPGSPLDGDGVWDKKYYNLLQDLWDYNQTNIDNPKHILFICHSFQMACHHFGIAEVCARHSMSFGTFPVHKTEAGKRDSILKDLGDPFWAADFRRFQVIQPNQDRLDELGAQIIALEKIRPHVHFERAIMGVRFSETIIGVQFHPEADPDGMREHFMDSERRKHIIEKHGADKYFKMIADLEDPEKIEITHHLFISKFLFLALRGLKSTRATTVLA